jgi:hypothetical protein
VSELEPSPAVVPELEPSADVDTELDESSPLDSTAPVVPSGCEADDPHASNNAIHDHRTDPMVLSLAPPPRQF